MKLEEAIIKTNNGRGVSSYDKDPNDDKDPEAKWVKLLKKNNHDAIVKEVERVPSIAVKAMIQKLYSPRYLKYKGTKLALSKLKARGVFSGRVS